jgi:hypothetical protein
VLTSPRRLIMSPNIPATTLSPDEYRREMKRRFDAVNAAEESRKNARYTTSSIKYAEEKSLTTRELTSSNVGETPEIGENDSSGG